MRGYIWGYMFESLVIGEVVSPHKIAHTEGAASTHTLNAVYQCPATCISLSHYRINHLVHEPAYLLALQDSTIQERNMRRYMRTRREMCLVYLLGVIHVYGHVLELSLELVFHVKSCAVDDLSQGKGSTVKIYMY